MLNRLRLKLALWLLHDIPENMWLGRYCGAHVRKSEWSAGRLDKHGVLQDRPIEDVFNPGDTACD